MSFIIDRGFNRATSKSSNANQGSVSSELFLKKVVALAPKAGALFAVVGLSTLVALSFMNGKLFFTELLLSSLIILALIFSKASAVQRK